MEYNFVDKLLLLLLLLLLLPYELMRADSLHPDTMYRAGTGWYQMREKA
jgi:hypothetical protein